MDTWGKFCGFMLKTLGWTKVNDSVEEDKCILLGGPHTSVWDFLISYLYYRSCGEKAKCMVKKEFFFPPVGWLLREAGKRNADELRHWLEPRAHTMPRTALRYAIEKFSDSERRAWLNQ